MIELWSWPTPNGQKVTIFLEEAGIDYAFRPVDITRGAQFEADFLAISPNNRIPALVDDAPADGGPPLAIFESGAILQYLASTTGRFYASDARGRAAVDQWLHWQMSGLGPMSGQAFHFHVYAPEPIPYARERYAREIRRLYGVMDRRLAEEPFLAGAEYSIADMACFPWLRSPQVIGVDLAADFPELHRWHQQVGARPGVQRGMAVAAERRRPIDAEARAHLFERKA